MKIINASEANTCVCPMALRACAGDRCMAWEDIGDSKGHCRMVRPSMDICLTKELEPEQPAKRGRPPKHQD